MPQGDSVIVAAELKMESLGAWRAHSATADGSGSCCSNVPDQSVGISARQQQGWLTGAAPRPGVVTQAGAGGTGLETSIPAPPRSSMRSSGWILALRMMLA